MKLFAACIKAAPVIGYQLGGVYLLTPPVAPPPLVYVGETSRTFAARWQEHLDALRQGFHANDGLRRMWREYGDLHATVLWIGPRAQVRAMERWWMQELRRRGYRLANEV